MFLLISLVLSFIFPMFSWSLNQLSTINLSNILGPITIYDQYNPASLLQTSNSLSILSIIYISGAVFLCLRFLSNLSRIYFLYFRYPKYRFKGFKAVILDNDQSPFTFFNILFISRNDFDRGMIDEMIVHEKAHQKEYHSFDIILLELMTIIQWFNPFLWMLRFSLKSEHEFIADHSVLTEGYDIIKYRNLIVEKSLGISSGYLTHGFNYSLIKKRLKMMTTHKSGSLVKIRYLIAMLMTIVLSSINLKLYGQNDEISQEVDVVAEYKNGGNDGLIQFILNNVTYPKSAIDNKIAAKTFVQFVIDKQGKIGNIEIVRIDILDPSNNATVVKDYKPETSPQINVKAVADIKAEVIRVVLQLDDFTPAQKDGKSVKSQMTIPFAFNFH